MNSAKRIRINNRQISIITCLLCCLPNVVFAQDSAAIEGLPLLKQQALELKPIVKSRLGRSFLSATPYLPAVEEREIFVRRDSKRAISSIEAKTLESGELAEFAPKKLNEHYFYFTRYGSPLAFVRPLEIAAKATGIENVNGNRIVDFGFGTIGHLRLLASLGADVTGIEVDSLLETLYSAPSDVGTISRVLTEEEKSNEANGRLELLFGSFPDKIADQVRGEVDWFISKNVLKRGYIHPEKPVDPKKLVQLGVTDDQFLRAIHQKLKVGGHFLIYNLHPAQAPDGKPYIPWADGRSPFDREAFTNSGFEILSFDVDDTAAAHLMAKALKWDEQMDLANDLFATYTLVRKMKR